MRLRPYAEEDLRLTRRLESDPRVVGHLGGVGDERHVAQVHQRRMAAVADGDLFFTILLDEEPVGIIAVWTGEFAGEKVYELGAMLLPDHQARGVAGRAFELLLPHVLDSGVRVLHAFPAVTNGPSNAILQKLGFTRGEDCDLDYEGRPLRCAHWVRELA
ncbi:GNAT family N-acetyltransferase [Actinoplanes sp. NPDC051346]|uniref:GNAT family N-acetyltransferase n=1 Tax=Actinoplanes sp. NPDC051346 TaxID=3155048 RepID=UPI003417654C